MGRKGEFCKMRILVIAATKLEIQTFMADSKGVEILITGVGVPATIYSLHKKLQQNSTDIVIQAGIAGSFENDIGLGEVTLVKQDTFADIGMEENDKFTDLFQAGLADKNAFPFHDGWLVNPNAIFTHSLLRAVKAITINKVSDSELQKQQAITNFAPQIESMEGAALHYVCLQENTPFIQLRSISNYVSERDKSRWKMKEAIANLNIELRNLIERLSD